MEKQAPKWYIEMTTKLNNLATNLGIEGPALAEIRNFVIEVAKSQYKSGNKSGIRFALSDEGKAYFAAKS